MPVAATGDLLCVEQSVIDLEFALLVSGLEGEAGSDDVPPVRRVGPPRFADPSGRRTERGPTRRTDAVRTGDRALPDRPWSSERAPPGR